MSSSSLDEVLRRVAEVMSAYRAAWSLCGGWAVDVWLGHHTRDHGDIDISVFHEDLHQLFDHLAGWNLIPHDARLPENREAWDGWPLEPPGHIHARPPGARNRELVLAWVTPPYVQARDGLDFEFLLNSAEEDAWVLSATPRISVPLADAFREAAGVPVVSPAILAFYKATAYLDHPGYPRPLDLADFDALLPLLGAGERTWLRESIAALYPDHAWLSRLPVAAR